MRTTLPSAIAIQAAQYEQQRPYRRSSTKSPQKRNSPKKRKAEKKQKALIERTNTFTFNDQPPPPPAKKVKVAAGVGVPVNRQANAPAARTTTTSGVPANRPATAPAARTTADAPAMRMTANAPAARTTTNAPTTRMTATSGVPANRPANAPAACTTAKSGAADSRATPSPTAQPRRPGPPAVAGQPERHREFPGWATPIPGSFDDLAAVPRPKEIVRAPPLVLPSRSRGHPNRPSAPQPQQPRHVSDPALTRQNKPQRQQPRTPRTSNPGYYGQAGPGEDPADRMLDETMDAMEVDFGEDPDLGGFASVVRDRRGVGFRDGYDEIEMDEIDMDPEAAREEEERDEVDRLPEDDFDREDDEGEDDEIGDGSPEDGGNKSDDEAAVDQAGGSRKRRRKTGESEQDAVVRKASSFGPTVGVAIQMACRYVRSMAITTSLLASVEEEEKIVRDAWPIVMQLKQFRGQSLPWKEIYYPTIKQYFSNIRGRVVGHCRTLLCRYFPFHREVGSKRANTRLYKDLIEDDAYTCEDPENQNGRWSHPLLFEVIYASFFPTRSSDGFRFSSKFFNPITLELVAIVFTAIRCSLDEWAKGTYMKLQFKTSIYTPVYERHLENLKALKRHDREAIAEFCSEIWEYASGAQGGVSMEPGPVLSSNQHAKAAQDLRDRARRKKEARQANHQDDSSEIDD
ncbi:hypothetical protein FS837_002154 [Tulasnella sp. UAMH 9824]|nr:hypothetical protein FS837_002154 [Tulasnella sp. UAMH 9824]